MALTKQAIPINFSQGLDTKQDPKQLSVGKFLRLQNTIFDKGGLLQKRNGYGDLTALPDNSSAYITTLNGNLTAIGSSIAAYNAGSSLWVSKGSIEPMSVDTLPLIRNNVTQIQCDAAISSNGLVCTVYSESNAGSVTYKYAVADSVTGQNIVAPIAIPVSSGTVTGSPRVFILGNHFIIIFTNVITAVSHLQYIAVSTVNPSNVTANADIASAYVSSTTLSWDGVVANNNLYIAYNNTTGGQNIKVTYLTSALSQVTGVTFAGSKATIMSLAADLTIPSSPYIYINFYDSSATNAHTIVVDKNLNTVLAATTTITATTVLNLTSAAQNGSSKIFYEVANNYSYDSGIPSHFVDSVSITQAGTVSSVTNTVRSVGIASKAFIINGTIYLMAVYQSDYQPTYFMINGSLSLASAPVISAKLAYENGGGYLTLGLPSVTVTDGSIAQVAYLFKDLISAVNKDTNVPAGSQVNGIYSQLGINLATFDFSMSTIDTAEIGKDLHISGGFLWMYDGYLPVEHNFFLWPDNIEATWSATGGAIHAQPDGATNTNAYFYQVTYEWTDNQGNAFRSAPSIPISVTTTGSGTAGSITINVPTLRLTYKTANPVKIVIYRWSVAQEIYYQVTSITSATLNSTTSDSIAYVDTLADATILGNNILYTTGGVVEDVNAPATNLMTLFDTRLWLVDAEDKNLLWFSKQVIEATPVEMSDLFTVYVAPTTAAQGSTGPMSAISVMDDKLIIFKQNAIYYINGTGPDNTGANNQYSQPIFVTSTVGCANQRSIVFTPSGLMFQSDKGIWLLGRDLSTSYIGAAVQEFTSALVQSAVNVPETNQVRFTLDSGITLMYDYYYQQWGEFTNVPAVSSCIYQGLHTFINSHGAALQETPGKYLDGSKPVLIGFTTGWINLAGLQGYQRLYYFYMLGEYLSPHKLNIQIAYDYQASTTFGTNAIPDNFSPLYGGEAYWGSGESWGGPGSVEQERIFPEIQKCQAFQISLNEVYDPTQGQPAGAGFTMSGIDLIVGQKSSYPRVNTSRSFG